MVEREATEAGGNLKVVPRSNEGAERESRDKGSKR